MPDQGRSCFACCPPIRPARYEHLPYKGILQRILRENTRAFRAGRRGGLITGFSCWALGYLDGKYQRIGCLLHPAQNKGRDLRDETGYGEKCRRGICPEARVFSGLSIPARRFWASLVKDLDSFAYSSRSRNPLFRLMGWGEAVLAQVAKDAGNIPLSLERLLEAYPFFRTELHPRAVAYLVTRIVEIKGPGCLRQRGWDQEVKDFVDTLARALQKRLPPGEEGQAVHRLGLDPLFQDFLRLRLQKKRLGMADALGLRQELDRAIEGFALAGKAAPTGTIPTEG